MPLSGNAFFIPREGEEPKGQWVEAYFHPATLELLLAARHGEILFRKK